MSRSEDLADCAPAAAWRLFLLGSWRLTRSRSACDLGINGQRLIALLALRGALDRSYVAGVLWPDCSDVHARGNLRATLCRLRRHNLTGLLDATGGVLSLGARIELDTRAISSTAQAVLDDRPDVSHRDALRVLMSEDLLLGWYDDWVLLDRERFRRLRLHALEALSVRGAARGDAHSGVEAGLAAVAMDPLRESAHRAVISAHLADGNLADALRQFEQLRTVLRTELAVEPSHLTTDLFR